MRHHMAVIELIRNELIEIGQDDQKFASHPVLDFSVTLASHSAGRIVALLKSNSDILRLRRVVVTPDCQLLRLGNTFKFMAMIAQCYLILFTNWIEVCLSVIVTCSCEIGWSTWLRLDR